MSSSHSRHLYYVDIQQTTINKHYLKVNLKKNHIQLVRKYHSNHTLNYNNNGVPEIFLMLYCQFIVVPESKDVCYHNRLRGRRAKGQLISLIRVSKGTYLLVSVLISTSRSSAPWAKQSPVRTNQAITLVIAIQYY